MAIRLSGTLLAIPAASAAINAFFLATDTDVVYVSDGNDWTERTFLDHADIVGEKTGLDAEKPSPGKLIGWIYHATDTRAQYEAFPTGWHVLADGVTDLKLADIRKWINGQYGLRFQSTGDDADLARTRKLVETVGASNATPYIVSLSQFILESFVDSSEDGAPPAQFDLLERDASDVPGGESEVTLATKDGFTDGSTLVKVITTDKIYMIVFAPGASGDGIYSARVSSLN